MLSRLGLGSMTHSVMAQNTLENNGVVSKIIKLSPSESKHGCAYGLEISSVDYKKAMKILKYRSIRFSQLN